MVDHESSSFWNLAVNKWICREKNGIIFLIDLLDYVNIPGYNSVYKNREQKHGGGVGAYLKQLDFKIREDLNRLDTTIELWWLEKENK